MNTNFQHKHEGDHEQKSVSANETQVEFATAEEALRFDTDQNPPPPEIAERLNKSIAEEPRRETSFWTKLGFRKG